MNKKVLSWALVFFVIALISWSQFSSSVNPSRLVAKFATYSSTSRDPKLSTPKRVYADISGIKKLDIQFKVNAADDYYDNFFQSDDGPNAIRLELTHPNTLNLVLSDNSERYFPVSKTFSLNQWHDIRLFAEKNKTIELTIDNERVFRADRESVQLIRNGQVRVLSRDPGLIELNNDFGEIVIGSGASRTRGLQGQINDFRLSVDYAEKWPTANIIASVLSVLISLAYLWHLIQLQPNHRQEIVAADLGNGMAYLGVVVSAAILGYGMGLIEPRFAKWFPPVTMALTILLLPIFIRINFRPIQSTWWALWLLLQLTGVAALTYLLYVVWGEFHTKVSNGLLLIAIYSSLGTSALFLVSAKTWGNHAKVIYALFLAVFSFAVWAALMDLPNWAAINLSMRKQPAVTLIGALLCLGLSWRYVFSSQELPPTIPESSQSRLLSFASLALPCIFFLVLAFRWDTLFLGSSALHWEYFVGPIRMLREGSWLLWDTPSQYGFLNILLPSLLPTSTSWQALYLFQGILLFIAASLAYISIIICAPRHKLFAFLLVSAGIFFADPNLIGPTLYPSSSVMRFFWCYVLLFLLVRSAALRNSETVNGFFRIGLFAWLLGTLWSLESAVYCSVIFFSVLTMAALVTPTETQAGNLCKGIVQRLRALAIQLAIALLSLSFVLVFIWGYYRNNLGFSPDWAMFYEHAFSYAAGFGSIAITTHGAGSVLILAFVGIASGVFRSKQISTARWQQEVALHIGFMSCIVAISTYFVGRAYSSNVTAVLPIIVVALAICLKIGKLRSGSSPIILSVVAIPLFVTLFVSSIGAPSFPKEVLSIKTMTAHIERQLPVAEPELMELMARANVTPSTNVTYYGFSATMPAYADESGRREVFDTTWLPNPLQLIEEPINPARRATTISRFATRMPTAGFFVQARGQNEDRATEWLSIIGAVRQPEQVHESQNYRIIQFGPVQYSGPIH